MNRDRSSLALILGSGQDVPKGVPIEINDEVLIICADDGASLARLWGLTPTIILGDWDSLDPATINYWEQQKIPLVKFPEDKDQTDLELAVDYALAEGATEVHIVGGWGTRVDHSLGNVQLLYRLALQGIPNFLYTSTQKLSACTGTFQAQVLKGSTVSLLPISSSVHGVETEGLLYPLHDAVLKKGSTWTISNVAIAENICVRFKAGSLLIIFE